ncbi:MAG: DNA polymerase/3'-5' exonuclease PolX [Anaerolineales bacterium]|nr:DNA polymerase/3'-5' exonuclease PolX [Anaerolineales bacterium]
MDNREVGAVFDRIADLLEIQGEAVYRVNSYRRAAESVRTTSEEVSALAEQGRLREIPGVGEAFAAKIEELLQTGRLAFYDKLAGEVPEGLVAVLEIQDVGPKKAARFWKELGVTSVDELEAAARAGRLRAMSGMGEKSEARILASIEAYHRRSGRTSIGVALPMAGRLLAKLRATEGVESAELGGSLRRWRETIGDIDLVVASADPGVVLAAFAAFPEVRRVRSQGDTKISVELDGGLQAQLWVHPGPRFGTAWQYATGSQAHNVRLRERAQALGLSLSEHGFRQQDGTEILAGEEGHVYNRLGLPWIPPELREDRGEVQAASAGQLPVLVAEADLRGELHAHSTWSDGMATIAEMAVAAREAGLEYLVISDHSQSLGVARGLTVDRLRAQRQEIEQAQRLVGRQPRLLQGTEVEILADGRLDFPDSVLAELDLVTASLHTSLRQPRQQATARLLAAIGNPHVDLIGHPTGRMVEGREGADLDLDEVLLAAQRTRTILEINAHPDRLDLNDVHARRAGELGCMLAINTDAHRPSDFQLRRYGVGIARRAWLEAAQIANAWPLDELQAWLRTKN